MTWPGLEIGAPLDDSQLPEAVENIFGYDWVIFKNAHAVDYFMQCFLKGHRRDELDQLRVLAIGSEAADQASEFRVHVDISVERFDLDKVYPAIQSYVGDVQRARLNVLVPNAGVSHEMFEEQLAAGGARVDSVTAYRTCAKHDRLRTLIALIAGGGIDFVAFTDAATINEFAGLFDTDDLRRLLRGATPVCSDQPGFLAAREFGLDPPSVPAQPSAQQLADLIKNLSN